MNLKLKIKILEIERSQISLAHEIGIPEPVLSKIVNGWLIPGDHLKEKIANSLHCSVEEIFSTEEKIIDHKRTASTRSGGVIIHEQGKSCKEKLRPGRD